MGKIVNFEIENFDVVEDDTTSQFATAKVRAFSSGKNRHSMICNEDVLKKTAPTIFNKPLLYSISKIFRDFGSHTDPQSSLIAGFVVPDTATFERLPDSRLSLNVIVKLWKRYAPKVIEILKKDGGKKAVSVEMDLLDSEERPDGLTEMKNFVYSGICLLGDMIQEASPGAELQMLSFAKEQEEYKKAYISEFAFTPYEDINFTIPLQVKKNVMEGLKLYKSHKQGGNSVSLALARHLIKNEKISIEKLKHMAKTHNSEKFTNFKKLPPSSDDYVLFMLYGGNEGKNWSNELINKMKELDNNKLSYFENVTFPYTSIKDINPALSGIDPPISLEQANAIARQAEAIGSDKEKNGWAIAISNFKKTHVVKDGRWVKKEKMSLKTKEEALISNEKEKNNMEDEKKETGNMDTNVLVVLEPENEEKEKESPKEEAIEIPEEGHEEEEEEMSLDANLDVSAILAMLSDETEGYKEIVEKEFAKPDGKKNYAKVCEALFAKMCKMAKKLENAEAENKAYMEENKKLKEFKLNIDTQTFNFEVDSTLKEIENAVEIPKSELDAMREDSGNFNLETITSWKNSVKAKAFTFATKMKKEGIDKEKRYGLPWNIIEGKKKSLWE